MKILIKTNLDAYRKVDMFPHNLTFVPRIGESIAISEHYVNSFRIRKFPLKLKVVDVTYYGDKETVEIEVWYSPFDVEKAKLNNIDLFN